MATFVKLHSEKALSCPNLCQLRFPSGLSFLLTTPLLPPGTHFSCCGVLLQSKSEVIKKGNDKMPTGTSYVTCRAYYKQITGNAAQVQVTILKQHFCLIEKYFLSIYFVPELLISHCSYPTKRSKNKR